jgi:hypothetical protein
MRPFLLCIICACAHTQKLDIVPARIEANTKALSSDEMGGRAPGSEGGIKAEEYVYKQFAAIGLETSFQTVPLREATLDDANSSFVVHGRGGDVTFTHAKDSIIFPEPRNANVEIDAPLVFVGWDRKVEEDVRGKIVVLFSGAPRELDGKKLDAATHAVLADIKKRTLVMRSAGALAVIVVFDPARAQRMPYEMIIPKILGPSFAWMEDGKPTSLPVLPSVSISEAGLDRILGTKQAHETWQQLDKGLPAKLDLSGITASIRIRSRLEDRTARNVVGLLRGTDPSEVVVYTAHLDHLGIGVPVDGDNIYNGALDDAIGVAGIIEMAHAFAALPQKPRRSILFLAVTGEEKGLLGSDYFVRHPTVPIEHIVADINIDGLGALYEPFDMVALGAEHSTIAAHAEAAARATGFKISADPDPDQVYFIRSDQYSFVNAGIPSVFPNVGWLDAQGQTAKYKQLSDDWSEHHYHRPSDIWRPEYDPAWSAKEAKFDFQLGLSIANAPERPHWNAGDAFSNMRLVSLQQP